MIIIPLRGPSCRSSAKLDLQDGPSVVTSAIHMYNVCAGVASASDLTVTHYEAVSVPTSAWTGTSPATVAAPSAIHCGLVCSKRGASGKKCLQFKFEDGVCQMSGWIPATSLQPSTMFFRAIIGLFLC